MTENIFLNQTELSRRWKISPRTLERWRWLGAGPRFYKIGGRVVYKLADVEAYEAAQLRQSTSDHGQAMMTGGAV